MVGVLEPLLITKLQADRVVAETLILLVKLPVAGQMSLRVVVETIAVLFKVVVVVEQVGIHKTLIRVVVLIPEPKAKPAQLRGHLLFIVQVVVVVQLLVLQ